MTKSLLTVLVFLITCSTTQAIETLVTGEYKIYSTIIITEDWCYMPDNETRVNGVTNYNTKVRSISTICVSLKSKDPQKTLRHEIEHAWRNAIGMDAVWPGHKLHCKSPNCSFKLVSGDK